MNYETQLDKELVSELENLNGMELATDEYKTTVDYTVKLIDRAIKIKELNLEYLNKERAFERENALKQIQMEEDKRDRLVKNCISAAGIIIPSVITIWGVVKSFEFEKEGTITTMMGRGFINKLLPKK